MRRLLLIGAAAGIALSPMTRAAPVEGLEIARAPAFTARELSAAPRAGWTTNGGNLYNQRYSPLVEINRDTVRGLKGVWRASLRGSGLDRKHSGQGQLLEYAGTLYAVTGNDDVFAISVATGKVLWEYDSHIDPSEVAVCCGWVSRGLGMGEGKIFLGRLDNKLVALDQRTGKVVWSTQSETLKGGGFAITAAPLYYDGLVIVGHAGGEMGIRGRLKAFDARTGKLRWVFYTIPAPGEPGHETWPADTDSWRYGGGAIWQTPSIDPELGLIIFSTDNPTPDLNGAVRAGDNLFTSSIMALDVKTGRYRWHFQEVHHDIWDYGGPNPVVLFDVTIAGQPRKGVVEGSKSGYVYILDRTNGKPLVGIEERPVLQNASQRTAPTQPIPVGDDVVPHQIDVAPEGYDVVNEGRTYTPFDETPIVYKPLAGINWPPSSYAPDSHLLFLCANDMMGVLTRGGERFQPPPIGQLFTGGSFGRVDVVRRGIMAAIDVTTNRLAWRRQWSDGCSSGSVNTAGGLLFMGRNDGRLVAYDTRDGRSLWEFQTDAPIAAPASVFEYQGTQYVAVMAAGTRYSPGKRGDGVWLFSLHGTLDSLPAGAAGGSPMSVPDINTVDTAAPPVGAADLAHGRKVYGANCEPCHGSNGQGAHGEGAALHRGLTAADVTAIATSGRRDMPSFRGVLTGEELRDVAGYIAGDLLPH